MIDFHALHDLRRNTVPLYLISQDEGGSRHRKAKRSASSTSCVMDSCAATENRCVTKVIQVRPVQRQFVSSYSDEASLFFSCATLPHSRGTFVYRPDARSFGRKEIYRPVIHSVKDIYT